MEILNTLSGHIYDKINTFSITYIGVTLLTGAHVELF